ncbi:hypothetical protein HIM_03738 [Hirsutella minnesotensis 3608]|uniref:RING-type domain-containing protein n=1 Tax=Hirsutella minnesotensis 3608 TaxID=1043627 RepID=A0A0F7ZM13_9HYPO|nr:hypothetical protein HIM_03738 [Hirsutella minnesotensis 3608]
MALVGGGELDSSSDDEIIEIQANPIHRRPGNLESMLNPQRQFSPAMPAGLRTGRRHRDAAGSVPQRLSRPQSPPRQPAAVIDLTEEPDSPADQRGSTSQATITRNPRRTNSQRPSPPRLARSDNTFIGPMTSFIDLTEDSPEDNRDSGSAPHVRLRHRHHHHHHHHPPRHHHHFGHDQLFELELRRSGGLFVSNIARGMQEITGILQNGLFRSGFHPQVDFPGQFSPREPSPKPPMEEVPPTRDGFTRDTCADAGDEEERVVICPACQDELAYDPTETTATSSKKRKRAPGEHHFWALKKCGHVYCADCFENRKPTKASPNGVGFRCPGGKPPVNAPNDLRCAVENCETKIASKTEWVGIFL